ncbi:MAG: serine/threonine-protein kinase [Thermoanaerobaculia bacterium]
MDSLDKYQVLEKIGTGGFGVVYKAYDPFIKRNVAIKTCTSEETETRERFMREAEIAGNLHHRNIVTVYDFGFQDGVPYLVQEYLSGEDLDRKIKRREFLSLPEKLLYLVQIVRGLQYAHSRGVVHRDIKPANIRILDDDTAKIMDFGIAKLAQHLEGLTQAGITLGTAAYLSPEQIRGGAFDARSDIFSFGILAYELLAFERPFQGAEISAVFYRVLNEEPPSLREKAPDCPEELERIIFRCLAKEPADRYAGSSDLLQEIEDLARRRPREGNSDHPSADLTGKTIASSPGPASRSRPAGRAAGSAPLSVGDIELDSRQAVPHPQSEALATFAFEAGRKRGIGFVSVLVGLVIAGVAAWGGWRYWQERTTRPGSPVPVHVAAAPGMIPTAPPEAAAALSPDRPGSANGAAPPATPGGATGGTAQTDSSAPSGGAPTGAASTAPAAAAPAAAATAIPAPPPAAPKPATLAIAPAWDTTMTVRLGSKIWTLDRERRIELAAGTYKLRFAITTAVFADSAETSVRLKEGQVMQMTSPIERPGRLTVQPHINARQAFVRIDGGTAVPTPLRGRWVSTGKHLVEIVAGPDAGAALLLTESVTIRSDAEAILTFDIDGRSPRRLSEKPILPN